MEIDIETPQFNITVVPGAAATVQVGSTSTGSPGSAAAVSNSGTPNAAVLDFTIPQGPTGPAATVDVGTVTTGAAGTQAAVSNSGSSGAAVLNFTIPRGQDGEVTLNTAQTLTNKTLTNPRVSQFLDSNGNVYLGSSPVANAVNYAYFQNAATTDFPKLRATGSDTNVSLGFRSKGAGAFRFQAQAGEEALQIVPVASAVNYFRFDSSAAGSPLPIWAGGTDTNIGINLIPKGSGTVQANGVPVVTTTGAQALTNKTISGSSNTVTNLPASATPDAARLVCKTATGGSGTENGSNTWAKLVTLNPAANGSAHLLLGISTGVSFQPQSAIISVYAYAQQPSPTNPAVAVQIIGMPNGGYAFYADAFKLVNNGYGQPVELWIKKSDQYTSFSVTEISRSAGVGEVTYNDGAAWQSAEPTGSAVNVRSTGVTVGGVPVVTTTGAQTLTNKTLTSPCVNQINDTNGATILGTNPIASAVNYLFVQNAATSDFPKLRANGSDADISINLIPKGSGTVQANGNPVVTTVSVPATATSTGKPGQIAYDSSYLYVCTATDTWRRTALSTW